MPISYTKRGWTNNSPPAINASNLGAMDDGLKNAVDALNNMGDAGQQVVKEIGAAPASTTGGKLVNKITEAGYSLAPATGTSNLDNISDGTSYARLQKAKADAINLDSGFMPAGTDTPTVWDNTIDNINRTTYYETSPFARLIYDTIATSISVTFYNNIYSEFPIYANIGIKVNGKYYATLSATANGTTTQTITLPEGTKRIEIVNGLASRPSSTRIGTFVTSVTFNNYYRRIRQATYPKIILYGDSISTGGNCNTSIHQFAIGALLQEEYNGLAVDAYGFRTLYDDCSTQEGINALVAKWVAYGATHVILAIGTNDYALNKWSANDFGTAYVNLVSAAKTAGIFVLAQTPFVRSSESANTFGDTLQAYRDKIIASGAQYIAKGENILKVSDLDDGVHPNVHGHILWAETYKTILFKPFNNKYFRWNPDLRFGGGNTNMVIDNYYYSGVCEVLSDDLVVVAGFIYCTSKGSSAGSVTIENLPFKVASIKGNSGTSINRQFCASISGTGITDIDKVRIMAMSDTNQIRFSVTPNDTALDSSALATAFSIMFTLFYIKEANGAAYV